MTVHVARGKESDCEDSADHLSELRSLRSKVAELACELAEQERWMLSARAVVLKQLSKISASDHIYKCLASKKAQSSC